MSSRSDIVEGIANEHMMLRADAAKVVKMVYKQIAEQLLSGNDVRITGVGLIRLKYLKPGIKRNNITGKLYDLPQRVVLKINTFKGFKDKLNASLIGD